MGGDLARLLSLYFRPRRAFAGIVDEGSLLFAFLAAGLASALLGLGPVSGALARRPVVPPAAAQHAPEENGAQAPGGPAHAPMDGVPADPRALLASAVGASGVWAVAGLTLVYTPIVLLAATLVASIGSFGVAFRRDFGPLLAAVLNAWAAAFLPAALVSFLTPLVAVLLLWTVAAAGFTVLVALAVRTVLGVRGLGAAAAALAGWLGFALQPCLVFLASPFLLYLAWQFLHGDIGDVLWSFRARQSFRRYLEAATINPRDADAHVQLGLIHLQRGQRDEAAARFRRAVEIDPREVDARFHLGRLAREDGRHEEALRHFEVVLEKDSAYRGHEAWREVGATYLDHGSVAEARWALEKFAERRPHDPEGLFHLGAAAARLGDAAAAKDAFQRCVESVDTMPRYRRGEVRAWAQKALQALAQLPQG
jgi:tetratricopeptide (TPR) repeat protein